jgi:hypothetical protein
MMPKLPKKKAGPLCRLPQLFLKSRLDKKRKHLDELISSSTSAPKDAPGETSSAKAPVIEIFDALDL